MKGWDTATENRDPPHFFDPGCEKPTKARVFLDWAEQSNSPAASTDAPASNSERVDREQLVGDENEPHCADLTVVLETGVPEMGNVTSSQPAGKQRETVEGRKNMKGKENVTNSDDAFESPKHGKKRQLIYRKQKAAKRKAASDRKSGDKSRSVPAEMMPLATSEEEVAPTTEPTAAHAAVPSESKIVIVEALARRNRRTDCGREVFCLLKGRSPGAELWGEWIAEKEVPGRVMKNFLLHEENAGLGTGLPFNWDAGVSFIGQNLIRDKHCLNLLAKGKLKTISGVAIARHSNLQLPKQFSKSLWTTEDVPSGHIFGVYAGQTLYGDSRESVPSKNAYTLDFERGDCAIVADTFGNELRYINSAFVKERQNCRFDSIVSFTGKILPVVRATKDIKAGTEILGLYDVSDYAVPINQKQEHGRGALELRINSLLAPQNAFSQRNLRASTRTQRIRRLMCQARASGTYATSANQS